MFCLLCFSPNADGKLHTDTFSGSHKIVFSFFANSEVVKHQSWQPVESELSFTRISNHLGDSGQPQGSGSSNSLLKYPTNL